MNEKMRGWVFGNLRLDPKTVGLYIAVVIVAAVVAINIYL